MGSGGPPVNQGVSTETLVALLLKWYHEADGISDEMTLNEIDRHNDMYDDLMALGIDPYER